MKERPILFNSDMVNAILEGRKTQTRRILKMGKDDYFEYCESGYITSGYLGRMFPCRGSDMEEIKCPYGKVGDRLWVREGFREIYDYCEHPEIAGCPDEYWTLAYQYRADNVCRAWHDGKFVDEDVSENDGFTTAWKPSIFMPRKVSRITLEITDIRVERLQDISVADDCWEEGTEVWLRNPKNLPKYADGTPNKYNNIKQAFQAMWQSINGKDSWQENPWVWVIEFKRIDQ